MIVAVFIYFIIVAIVIAILKKTHIKYKNFPELHMGKNFISFTSFDVHRLKLETNKYMQVGKVVYLKYTKNLVVIKNVDQIIIEKSFIYFKGLGKVKICFNNSSIYKYFNLYLKSSKFNVKTMKNIAILDIFENFFNISKCVEVKNYINFIKNVLNIEITNSNIVIKQNRFRIPYELIYKVNGNYKKIYVN